MSGYANISAVPDQNILYNAASGHTLLANQNQLLQNQGAQQDIGLKDMAMMGQAGASLLNMPEDQAASLYPQVRDSLQTRGFGKDLPATYPGHAAVQAFVQRALSLPDQYKLGIITPPGTQAAIDAALGRGGTTTGGATGTGGAGGTLSGDTYEAAIGGHEGLGADKNLPSTVGGFRPGTWQGFVAANPTLFAGMTPEQAAAARSDPKLNAAGISWLAQQNAAQLAQAGVKPSGMALGIAHYLGAGAAAKALQAPDNTPVANFVSPEAIQYNPELGRLTVGQLKARYAGVPDPGFLRTATGGPPGSQQTPPGVTMGQVGDRTVPPPPGGSTAPYTGGGFGAAMAPGAPAGRRLTQAERLGGTQVAGPPMVASTNPTAPVPATDPLATPARYAGTAPAPSVEAAPETGWGSQVGSGYGPQNALAPAVPPAAPATAPASQQPPAPATRGGLPRAADVPTGVNSQQYRDAADLQRRALILEAQVDPTGRLKQLAAGLRQQAQLLLQTDSVVQTQEGQLHPLTGQIGDPTKPLPHYVYDPTQHAYIDTTGTNKPEFEPAQRDSAVAQRDVMELGPKVANGTATPQEQARYATAVETYRQPKVMTDPISKQLIRVNERELPSGFPEPGGSGAAGGGPQPITQGLSPAQQQVERDPAAYKVAETQYTADAPEARELAVAGRQSQADQVRIKEMQDVLQRFNTGPGTEGSAAASAFLQRWLPSALTGWEKESANLSGAAAAEAFSKLALVGAGTQERGVLGARGGYQAIKLFKDANPNVNLLDATNKSILDMQLITNQANSDYTQAALSHFADNETKFKTTHQYDSLNQFDRNWNAQRNPEVYAAAMGAISGQSPEKWTKGLSDAEYQRAQDIVHRANPQAVIYLKGQVPPGSRPPLTSFQR